MFKKIKIKRGQVWANKDYSDTHYIIIEASHSSNKCVGIVDGNIVYQGGFSAFSFVSDRYTPSVILKRIISNKYINMILTLQ